MTKAICALLAAAIALFGGATASASPPVITTLPDIIIGDAEDNGASDSNFFVFENAFNFDDYVSDDLTPDADLKWSFDEGDDPPLFPGATSWYTINDKSPVHVGTVAASDDTSSSAPHVNPAPGNELRGVSETASFRDIVFSPSPGSGPFPVPADPDKSAHADGKVITFHVSDGTFAASKSIIVKTIDNAPDTTTSEGFQPFTTDTFETNGAGSSWVTGGATANNTNYNQFSYDPVTGAYKINVTAQAGRFRIAFWNNQRLDWLPYTHIGSEKYVRVKYYLYNSDSNTTGGHGTYSVPNFNLKLSQRFAVTALLTIQTHDSNALDLSYYKELAPSTNPALPSLYRMDFDPIDIPFMATRTPPDGIQSAFEIFSLFDVDNGTIAMTEEEIGTYPKSELRVVKASQVYDNALLTHANSTVGEVDLEYDLSTIQSPGEYPSGPTGIVTPGRGTMASSAAGVTYDTTAVPANRVAYIERTFFAGDDKAARMRIAEGEQYTIRYHLASTRPTSNQSTIWLKARAAKFGYTNYLQIGGGQLQGVGGLMSRQATVGAGTENPDAGQYTILMNTPLDGDIRPEIAGPINVKMPNLGAATHPGRGENLPSAYRDIRVGVAAYDTLTAFSEAAADEAAQFTVERIEINAYDRIGDGAFFSEDTFQINGTGTAWTTGGATAGNATYNQFSHDPVTGAYRINVTAQPNKFRIAYWNNQRPYWLPYSSVGSENYVRGKFYVYNTGSNTTGAHGTYSVPNFNLKLSQRFAITASLSIQTHDSISNDLRYYKELAPSTNANLPSLYRMDFDPIDVPFMMTRTPVEGIQSGFEIFGLFPEDSGTIALTEEEIATYPKSELSVVRASQVYDTALLTDPRQVETNVEYQVFSDTNPGDYPAVIQPGRGTMTNSAEGVTFSTTAYPTYAGVAHLDRTFFAGDDRAARMRIAEGEQYTIRYHLTSTRPTSNQATIWLHARGAKFGYTNYLQIGGGQVLGLGGEISRQATVGTGTANPSGGWYTILMNTPLDGDIRPDVTGPLTTKMPNLADPTLPGRGANVLSPFRDIRVAVGAYDTLTPHNQYANGNTEAAHFTLDRIELNAYNRVTDGGYQ